MWGEMAQKLGQVLARDRAAILSDPPRVEKWLMETKLLLARQSAAILPDHHMGRNGPEIRAGISSPYKGRHLSSAPCGEKWLMETKLLLARQSAAILPDHHVGRNGPEIRAGISSTYKGRHLSRAPREEKWHRN